MTGATVNRQNVFIGGTPRSGTTLLGSILGSHSQMLATPESQFKFELTPLFNEAPPLKEKVSEFINRHPRFAIWNFNPEWHSIDVTEPSTLLHGIVRQYGGKRNKPDYTHWIDHTPSNLRHSHYLDAQYPGCVFIHIVRDGRAVMASQFKLDWGSNDPIFASLKWMESIALGLACEAAFPGRTLSVRYEHLVQYPEQECAKICEFLGLPFEPSMILGAGYEVPRYTQSQHTLLGNYPDTSRIDDWKNTLTTKDIQMFEALTYDLLPLLGYQKEFPGIHAKPKELTQAWILFKGAFKYLTLNSFKRRARVKKNT